MQSLTDNQRNTPAGRNEPFVMVPKSVLRSQRLSLGAKLLLVLLTDHRNPKTGQCNPKIGTLAREMAESESTVKRTLAELVSAGLIRITWEQRSSQYEVAPRSRWPKILIGQIDPSEIASDRSDRPNTLGQIDPSDGPVSITEPDPLNETAAAAAAVVVPENGNAAAAAFASDDLNELEAAMAGVTGHHPGPVMVKQIAALMRKAGGDIPSAVLFVASFRRRHFKSNGVWPRLFTEDYPAFVKQTRAAEAAAPKPKPMDREHAATMERIRRIAAEIPK